MIMSKHNMLFMFGTLNVILFFDSCELGLNFFALNQIIFLKEKEGPSREEGMRVRFPELGILAGK